MKSSPWQVRARAAGLTQKTIAYLTRRNENSVGRALSGVRQNPLAAGPYIAVILAYEVMNEMQRAKWLLALRKVIAEEDAPPAKPLGRARKTATPEKAKKAPAKR